MNISGLLGTFASSLQFYISEFERIILHVSGNLPLINNQIENNVSEARGLLDTQLEDFKEFNERLDVMLTVKKPIYEILVEMQRQDIIQQQMNHLLDAVGDVQKVVEENESEDEEEDFDLTQNLLTLISFLLQSIEKQMTRINRDLLDLVEVIEGKFSDLNNQIQLIHNDKKAIAVKNIQLKKNLQSIMNVTESLSNEMNQYNSFFKRLRLLHDDMKREVVTCSNLKSNVDVRLLTYGGLLSLVECQFSNNVIQKIVDKLSVEEERLALKEEFSELTIEAASEDDVVLF